jgi:hypothetical protein
VRSGNRYGHHQAKQQHSRQFHCEFTREIMLGEKDSRFRPANLFPSPSSRDSSSAIVRKEFRIFRVRGAMRYKKDNTTVDTY